MAGDLSHMRPSELVRLLYPTPLGEVTSERHVYRDRKRAGLRIGEAYELGSGMHRLWLSTGGSAGHSSLVGLDISEGIYDPLGATRRAWVVTVLKPQNVITNEARRQEVAHEEKAETKAKARQEACVRNWADDRSAIITQDCHGAGRFAQQGRSYRLL